MQHAWPCSHLLLLCLLWHCCSIAHHGVLAISRRAQNAVPYQHLQCPWYPVGLLCGVARACSMHAHASTSPHTYWPRCSHQLMCFIEGFLWVPVATCPALNHVRELVVGSQRHLHSLRVCRQTHSAQQQDQDDAWPRAYSCCCPQLEIVADVSCFETAQRA